LKDPVARIDTPQLEYFNPQFFYQPIFDISPLIQFMHRAEKLKPPSNAHVDFCESAVVISLTSREGGHSALVFDCAWTLAGQLIRLLAHCLPLLSQIDTLHLGSNSLVKDGTMPWLDFFRLFNTVETLRVDGEGVQLVVATALAGGRGLAPEETEDVFPKLQAIVGHFESEVVDIMEPFLRARSESGQPIDVQNAM
jgi:hypothetical protein